MADTIDPARRSANMAAIGSRDTKPELFVRRILRDRKIGYRLGNRIAKGALPARPDIVLKKYGAVVFVHGCYWHRHGCVKTTTPSSNQAFWLEKFERNVSRDARVQSAFLDAGWRVATIWECGTTMVDAGRFGNALTAFLHSRTTKEFFWPPP